MDDQPVTPPVNTTPPTATEAVLPGVPQTWPGAFGAYKYSKQAVKLNLVTLVVLYLLAAIFGGASEHSGKAAGLMITLNFVSLIVGSLASAAYTLTFIAGVRGQQLSISEALKQGLSYWLKSIGLTLLVAVSLIGSLILLIMPFFFVFPRLTLAEYYLVDKNLSVVDAYKASWNATKGHTSKVWGIVGANILMALLCVTIIGIPFSIYFLVMYSAVLAVLYELLNKSQPVAAATPAPATPVAPPAAS